MAYKYQTFADLLYASYSGLQTLVFAFAKGRQRYDRAYWLMKVGCKMVCGFVQVGEGRTEESVYAGEEVANGLINGWYICKEDRLCRD